MVKPAFPAAMPRAVLREVTGLAGMDLLSCGSVRSDCTGTAFSLLV
jgi:hypothetical protein